MRDDLNELSASVDGRVSRHINSTKGQNVSLRKAKNTVPNVAKREISTFMQDVSQNNQEVSNSFCRSELTNTLKFAELDREVANLREQISRAANTTRVQHNYFTLSDISQLQSGQSGNLQPVNLAHLTHRI
jgi:hypothetical protein